ncbi:MAG TPA: substrate-binding domain-containing protein, partial [Pseudonocardiaceae bacterium]
LDRDPRITALICTSDILAIGAMSEARRRGLRVPQDLSITGFDGIAEAEQNGLTTVRQPMLEKGRAAGRLLIDSAEASHPRTITLRTELVPGETTARPLNAEERWFGP